MELRTELYKIYNFRLFLYHGSVLLPDVDAIDPEQLELSLSLLEAAQEGRVKILEQEMAGTGVRSRYTHYFYASSAKTGQMAVDALSKALDGIDGWLKDIPKGLVPAFRVPQCSSKRTRDLILWTSLVYYLASQLKAPYLNAVIECRRGEYYHEEWSDWPQPIEYDLAPLITYQVDPCFKIERWAEEFAAIDEHAFWLPDFIDAYLEGDMIIGEFVTNSIAAVDCLLFMLQGIVEGASQKSALSLRAKRKKTKKEMATQLKSYLLAVHLYNDGNVEFPLAPLRQTDIATAIRCNQSYISKLMKEVFPPYGHKSYRTLLGGDIRSLKKHLTPQSNHELEVDDL